VSCVSGTISGVTSRVRFVLTLARCFRGRPGIATVDRLLDARSAIGGREPAIALDGGEFVGQVLVLDRVANPGRVIPSAEVVQPGPIVDPSRDLQEQREVLNAKAQGAVGAAELEAAIFTELALAVLAGMAPALQLGLDHPNLGRRAAGAALPQQSLAPPRSDRLWAAAAVPRGRCRTDESCA
jgi:hypothetical protein